MMTIKTMVTLSGHYLLHAEVPLRVEYGANSGLTAWPYNGPSLHLYLSVCKNGEPYVLFSEVRDHSDYVSCRRYACDKSNYRAKTHELLNWMREQNLRLVSFRDICTLQFFSGGINGRLEREIAGRS